MPFGSRACGRSCWRCRWRDVSAKDENGGEIGIDRSEGTLEVPVEGNGAAVEIEFPLEAPARSVKTLASLKGKLTAVVLGKIETFEFADIDKAKVGRAGARRRYGDRRKLPQKRRHL